MTHTKPPWKYTLNVGPTKALIVEADGSTIAEIANRTHDSRFLANVRVMTAAPDLLEAAHLAALNFKRTNPESLCDDDHEAWGALDRAIAKAEGRA